MLFLSPQHPTLCFLFFCVCSISVRNITAISWTCYPRQLLVHDLCITPMPNAHPTNNYQSAGIIIQHIDNKGRALPILPKCQWQYNHPFTDKLLLHRATGAYKAAYFGKIMKVEYLRNHCLDHTLTEF